MSARGAFGAIDVRVTRWLTAPLPNAAGRLGLFRILFAAFYLWYLTINPVETMAFYGDLERNQTKLVDLMPTIGPDALRLMQAALVAALVLLAVGLRTQLATAAVLAIGAPLEAISWSVDPEHATVMLTALIPAIMLVAGGWGDTWSLDALRARGSGRPVASVRDQGGRYALAPNAIFAVLAMLFASAAIFKLLPSATWLDYPDFMANIFLEANVNSAIKGQPTNPVAGWLAQTPLVHESMRFGGVAFEATFALGLFSSTLRRLVIPGALVFHASNEVFLNVTFIPIVIAYAPFVDWQAIADRLPFSAPRPDPGRLVPVALGVALGAAALWWGTGALEALVSLGGVLRPYVLGALILPFALGWLAYELAALTRRLRDAAGPAGAAAGG